MSFYETWVTTKYGVIFFSEAKGGFVEIHVATVRLYNGAGIGMGDSRESAIMDLYEDLRSTPIEAPLQGYWRERREKLKRREAIGGDA
jgi:hypothetical protein